MKIHTSYLILLYCVLMVACDNEGSYITNITILNESQHDLDWVELKWDGPYVPGGIIPQGAFSTAVYVSFPRSEGAELTFVDEETRERFSVIINLTPIYTQKGDDIEEIVFRIVDYETVRLELNISK